MSVAGILPEQGGGRGSDQRALRACQNLRRRHDPSCQAGCGGRPAAEGTASARAVAEWKRGVEEVR